MSTSHSSSRFTSGRNANAARPHHRPISVSPPFSSWNQTNQANLSPNLHSEQLTDPLLMESDETETRMLNQEETTRQHAPPTLSARPERDKAQIQMARQAQLHCRSIIEEQQQQQQNQHHQQNQQVRRLRVSSNTLDQNHHHLRRRRRRRRLLDRDAAYFQSRGRWHIQHVSREAARAYPQEVTRTTTTSSSSGTLSITTSYTEPAASTQRITSSPPRLIPLRKQFWDDWFHALAYQRTIVLMGILLAVYSAIVVYFGILYLIVSHVGRLQQGQEEDAADESSSSSSSSIGRNLLHWMVCDMDLHGPLQAFYFSLSTMASIGYGASDYFFGNCWAPLLLVLFQVASAITFDAVAIGLLFHRFSRGHKRGKTILFSDKAVIRRVRKVPMLMFRVGELRRHQLLEATVRAYCVRHERHVVVPWPGATRSNDHYPQETKQSNVTATSSLSTPSSSRIETVHYVTRPLRLAVSSSSSWQQQSQDASSSQQQQQQQPHILMSLPQVLVHRIDETSPLLPPRPCWYDFDGRAHQPSGTARDLTEVSGDSIQHEPGDRENDDSGFYSMEDIHEFLYDREAEIIVLLEGTDELTGTRIQARHSYAAHDLAWNQAFVPCVYHYQSDENDDDEQGLDMGDDDETQPGLVLDATSMADTGGRRCWPRAKSRRSSSRHPACIVDFARFHDIVPAPDDCQTCPFVIE